MFRSACVGAASMPYSRNPIHPPWCGRNWSSFSAMTCTSVKFRRGIYLAALMACGVASAHSQGAPPVQEILNRLDRLEKNNEALLEEVRALRQEISTLRTPAAEAAAGSTSAAAGQQPLVAPEPTAAERQAVQQSRIEELAQTKVETSEKFPLRITGMVLFNALLNGQNNNNADNPVTASLTQGDLTGEGTLRQSTLGFLFHGPQTFLGG